VTGNRDLPLTGIFHHSCFSPPPKRYIVNLFVEPSPSASAISFTGSHSIHCWELSSSLPTLSFLGPQGFIPPLLPLALARPSSPSPPLSFPTRNTNFLQRQPHSFCDLGSALRDLPLSIPHDLRVLPFVVLSTQAYVLLSVFPVKQTPSRCPLDHRL
jgi:hypothetical protein